MRLLQASLLFTTAYLPATILAQTSTVIVIPTPLPYQDAQSVFSGLGPSHSMYPVLATPTDPVYAVINARPEQRFWIRRRGGGTCTNLNKGLGSGDLVYEGVCGEALPAVCKDCRFGGDGCSG